MRKFSIVTLVKGRRKQLANLLDSIALADEIPFDIQVVSMDNDSDFIIPKGLQVSIKLLNSHETLPLAAARNFGITACKTDTVIFIDVDCIVSPSLFTSMLDNLEDNRVVTAYPVYLPSVPEDGNFSLLKKTAVPHPARAAIKPGEIVEYWQFWSLIFAVKKNTFLKTGGFDESFTGYGAEDTDFAKNFNDHGIHLIFIRDFVLHQYHDKYDPPLNYFESIVRNANRYLDKWGDLPMRKWLREFEEMNLIIIDDTKYVTIVRKPTAKEINDCYSKSYF